MKGQLKSWASHESQFLEALGTLVREALCLLVLFTDYNVIYLPCPCHHTEPHGTADYVKDGHTDGTAMINTTGIGDPNFAKKIFP